MNSYIYFC